MGFGKSVLAVAILPAVILATRNSSTGSPPYGNSSEVTYSLREVGARHTLDWRIWLERDGQPASFWHDVPLYPDTSKQNIVNFVVEIPRWTDGKIEIQREEPLNPIFHDKKSGAPRYVESVWPHKTYPFLYGSIPQTWENPNVNHSATGFPGDNDPMDVFDISSISPGYSGQIKQVKVLGGLALIDDDATDWKVMVIDINDPLASLVDSVEDLSKYLPTFAQTFYDWFLYYKVVRGNGVNTIIGDYHNASYMAEIIAESHEYWKTLVDGKSGSDDINYNQTSTPSYNSSYVNPFKATETLGIPAESNILPPAARPEKYDHWYYLDEDYNVINFTEIAAGTAA